EITRIAYDSNTHVIFGGSFDNGSEYQLSPGSLAWNTVAWGDGNVAMVDNATLAASNRSIRYTSAQSVKDFRRQVFDATNKIVPDSDLLLTPRGLPDFSFAFIMPTAIDAIAPTAAEVAAGQSQRIVIGGRNGVLYEANNTGTATTAAAINWMRVDTR